LQRWPGSNNLFAQLQPQRLQRLRAMPMLGGRGDISRS
jgi:hypothetical protein